MRKEAAKILQKYGELNVRNDYSGRGMYGSETWAVVGSYRELFEAIAETMAYGNEEDREALAEALPDLRIDNMALDYIFY